MKSIKNLILIFFIITFVSCFNEADKPAINKSELKKIEDSIKRTLNDSITKIDSTKTIVGIAKLNKKTKVILYNNYKWKYQNLAEQQYKKPKVTQKQVKTFMQNYEHKETQYVSGGICGASTKGWNMSEKSKGGGRCWQH